MDANLNPKQITIDLLTAIDYEGDKEKYASDMLGKCYIIALDNLLAKLPDERKKELQDQAKSETDEKKVLIMLRAAVGEDAYLAEVQKVVQESYTNLVKTLMPSLSAAQKDKLKVYIESAQSSAA